MSLSQLAELACSKRPFSAMQYIEQLALPSPEEPPRKKVRFEGAAANANDDDDDDETMPSVTVKPQQAPQELERLMEKVRQRAARRRTMMSSSSSSRTSYSPPPPAQTVTLLDNNKTTTNNKPMDLPTMQRKLERMEQVIKKTARAELQLMNQSKKLRDKRAGMTRKYESMAAQLAEMQQSDGGGVFQMGVLPPLMDKSRRVSATREQIGGLAC